MTEKISCSTAYNRRLLRRSRSKSKEDPVTGDVRQTVTDIVKAVQPSVNSSDRTTLNYLNLFAKITRQVNGNFSSHGFTTEDLLSSFRTTLFHTSTEIRSGGLRAIRHVLNSEEDVILFNKMKIPYLLIRSLDLCLRVDTERMEAVKTMRRVLVLAPDHFDKAMARCLVAQAQAGLEEKSRMLRACLATLSELGTLHPELLIESGGVAAITGNLLECQTPKIAESLCGVLLLLLDRPETRQVARIDLHSVAAPYTDFHLRHCWKDKNRRDERELKFHSSRRALLTLLRSWSGILHFCSPANKIGLKAIIQALYLDQLEVRKGILDLLYDLFGLQQPEWTDELSVALQAIDPSEPHGSWRLNEGHVAAEGRAVLPHLAASTPDLLEAHKALLLQCLLADGLLPALARVIATGDTFISVRATVFLGEILRLVQYLLPSESGNFSPELPSLLEYAVTNKPQALTAIAALQQFHKLLKKCPASNSLFLDYIIRSGYYVNCPRKDTYEKIFKHRCDERRKPKLPQFIAKEEENSIKETGILTAKDAYTWDWNLIKILLRVDTDFKFDLLIPAHRVFFEQLIAFFTPSSNRYSHMDLIGGSLAKQATPAYTLAAIDLIHCLVDMQDSEASRMLIGLFTDILYHVRAIRAGKSVHDCLFSPQHMLNTQCQSYFLFIGRLGTAQTGANLLNSIHMYQELEELCCWTHHDCYLKLTLASLDHSQPGPARSLLARVLQCPLEASRLYATRFLSVLLRAGVPDVSTWGVRLLVGRLSDASALVREAALDALSEACEVREALETLIRTDGGELAKTGDRGVLLGVRFLSVPLGLEKARQQGRVEEEIARWETTMNFRYVRLLEELLNNALTLNQCSEDGAFDASNYRGTSLNLDHLGNGKELYVPPHLYGQLSQLPEGFQMIMEHGSVKNMIETVHLGHCSTDTELLRLRAALWALGHFSLSTQGCQLLGEQGVFGNVVALAQGCPVYSVRATAYYVISLIATTPMGADSLLPFGWISTRHDRHDMYPFIEETSPEGEVGAESEWWEGSSIAEDSFYCIEEDGSCSPGLTEVAMGKTSMQKPQGSHQRSLSETATLEFCKDLSGHGDQSGRRFQGHEDAIKEGSPSHLNDDDFQSSEQTAVTSDSVIPSSVSFTLGVGTGEKVRRHSESCKHTPPMHRSDRRLQSLDRRDVAGYATLRSLRSPGSAGPLSSYRHSLPHHSPARPTRITRISNDYLAKMSLMSLSSIKKFQMKGDTKHKKQGYLGICLPVDILQIFPEESRIEKEEPARDKHRAESIEPQVESEFQVQEEGGECQMSLKKPQKYLFHDTANCLKCYAIDIKAVQNSGGATEILRQTEQLANPGWSEQVKQVLIARRLRNPEIFRDACLYSEVNQLMATRPYRAHARRLLQELFFDLPPPQTTVHVSAAGDVSPNQSPLNQTIQGREESILPLPSESSYENLSSNGTRGNDLPTKHATQKLTSSIKTLESLNLKYKENKFPIKDL